MPVRLGGGGGELVPERLVLVAVITVGAPARAVAVAAAAHELAHLLVLLEARDHLRLVDLAEQVVHVVAVVEAAFAARGRRRRRRRLPLAPLGLHHGGGRLQVVIFFRLLFDLVLGVGGAHGFDVIVLRVLVFAPGIGRR